jgi:hypothetical protein
MSLKIFHIVFITLSTLLWWGCGAWLFSHYQAEGEKIHLVLACASFLIGVALVVYGVWFLKKMRRLIL